MAFIPIVSRDRCGNGINERFQPRHLLDKYTEDILPIIDNGSQQDRKRSRPCSCSSNTEITEKSSDGFQITVDVQQFKPEEISVKIADGGCITVDGKHEEGEEEDETGCVFRRFVRLYHLPEGSDGRKLQTSFSSDGVLTISARNFP